MNEYGMSPIYFRLILYCMYAVCVYVCTDHDIGELKANVKISICVSNEWFATAIHQPTLTLTY